MTAPDPILGRQVGGYVITRRLGEGGMGAVYLAENPELPQKRVVKVLLAEAAAIPSVVERFKLEARAASRIKHGNVIEILDVSEFPDGTPYILMPFLEGRDLDAYCRRSGAPQALGVEYAWPILVQVAVALMAAHAKGIVHRDLKAGNVFLVEEGYGLKVILIDFGLAKVRDPQLAGPVRSLPHLGVGTPSHMAPEQARGKPLDQRADIYAFGTMAYLLLTGRYPYYSDDIAELLAMKLTTPPPDPRAFAPELPEAWAECLLACLQIDPELRPATMKEVATTLMNGVPFGPDVARGLAAELFAVSESWEPTAKAPTESTPRASTARPPELPTSTPMAAAIATSVVSAPPRSRAALAFAAAAAALAAVLVAIVLWPSAKERASEAKGEVGSASPTDARAMAADRQGESLATAAPVVGSDAAVPSGVLPDAGAPVSPTVVAGTPEIPASPAGGAVAARTRPGRDPKPARPPAEAGTGTAFITASPWAEVWIDGHSEGTTPVKTDLAAGAHRLKLEKPDGSVEESTFRVKPGEETRIKRSWETP